VPASYGLTSHHLGELHVPQSLIFLPTTLSSKNQVFLDCFCPPFPNARSPLHDTNRYTAPKEPSKTGSTRNPTRHPTNGAYTAMLVSAGSSPASPSRNLGNEIERIVEVSITHLVGERSWRLCSLRFQQQKSGTLSWPVTSL
jgi:hypothetical protein